MMRKSRSVRRKGLWGSILTLVGASGSGSGDEPDDMPFRILEQGDFGPARDLLGRHDDLAAEPLGGVERRGEIVAFDVERHPRPESFERAADTTWNARVCAGVDHAVPGGPV